MSRILLHVKICRDVDVPLSLIRKLELFTKLSASDRDALSRIATDRVRHYAPREDLVREGEPPDAMYIMLDGWACRYKFLEDGRRQIVAFFLPGDVCDFNVFILKEMDHSIAAINQVRVGEVARDSFQDMIDLHPRVTQAFWWETLVNASIQREWTVNLGQRDAIERMAHLLCEVFLRLRGAGRTRGNACEFPITQADLADATGCRRFTSIEPFRSCGRRT